MRRVLAGLCGVILGASLVVLVRPAPAAAYHPTPSFFGSSGCGLVEGVLSRPAQWTQFGYSTAGGRCNPYEDKITPANVSTLTLKWTATPTSEYFQDPVVANGIVYVNSFQGDNHLYAINATTGAILWKQATGGPNDDPAVAGNVVYVAGGLGIQAFKATTGQLLWQTSLPPALTTTPLVSGNVLYEVTSGGAGAYNALTGAQIWTAPYSSQTITPPMLANDVLYFGDNGQLTALNAATGALLWQSEDRGIDIISSPLVANGLVYVSEYFSSGVNFSVYAAAGCGNPTCAPIWQGAAGAADQSTLALAGGHVFVESEPFNGGSSYELVAFNAQGCGSAQCNPLWQAPISTSFAESSPAVANGVVFVGEDSPGDSIVAFDASTGKQLWSYKAGSDVFSSPVVVNGMLYVSSRDGKLYAFSLPASNTTQLSA